MREGPGTSWLLTPPPGDGPPLISSLGSESNPDGIWPGSEQGRSTSGPAESGPLCEGDGIVSEEMGLEGFKDDCGRSGVGDGGVGELGSWMSGPSSGCFVRMCWVRPPLLRKCRGQWGQARVGGGGPSVNVL
jgi:hypothetical protein